MAGSPESMFDPEVIAELRQQFDAADADGDGEIDAAEACRLFAQSTCPNASEEELQRTASGLRNQMDADRSGTINFKEYCFRFGRRLQMERNRQRRQADALFGKSTADVGPATDAKEEELRRAREELEKEREALRREREALKIEQERAALKKEREDLKKREQKTSDFFRDHGAGNSSGSASSGSGAGSEGSASSSRRFEAGTRVRLQGLKAAAELNGQVAKVLRFDDSAGRYVVELEGGGQKSLRGESLVEITASSEWWSRAKERCSHGLSKTKEWAGVAAAKAQGFFAGYELWQIALGVLVVALVVGAYMQNAARYSSRAASNARRQGVNAQSDFGAGQSWDNDYRDHDQWTDDRYSRQNYDRPPPRRSHREDHYDDYDDGYGYGGGGGILDGLLGGFGISGQTQTYLIIGVLAVLCWKGIIPVHRMDFFQLYMLWNMIQPLIGGRSHYGGYGRGYGRRRMW